MSHWFYLSLIIGFALATPEFGDYGVYVNPDKISVSGLSSGAFFAVQMHVAHSSMIMGSAIFAGGPYYCAQDQLTDGFMQCMYATMPLDINELISDAQQFAKQGEIDNLSNLKGDHVFVYSGTEDTVVNPKVVQATEQFYQAVGCNVTSEFSIASEHTLPTTYFGNDCWYLGSPYISNCKYDGAGAALLTIYGQLNPRTASNSSNIISLDQNKYTPSGNADDISFGPTAYAYIPSGCRGTNNVCSLNVAFHGCSQTVDDIGNDYYTNTGFNKWAESNNIVMLYPQAKKSMFSPSNEEGCFDWWGYTNSNYAVQSGPQIQTVKNMIQAFVSSDVNLIGK